MASQNIKASELFDPVEIELWTGDRYRLREATRSVEEKVIAKHKEIGELPEDSDELEALPYLLDMLDILLEPLSQATDEEGEPITVPAETTAAGNPKKGTEMVPKMVTAQESLQASLDADEIGFSHINALTEKINKAAIEARPT